MHCISIKSDKKCFNVFFKKLVRQENPKESTYVVTFVFFQKLASLNKIRQPIKG